MKKTATKSYAKREVPVTVRKGRAGNFTVVRDRDGRMIQRAGNVVGNVVARVAPIPESLRYDAEDIAEANRMGEAICRQHAR